MRQSKKRRAGTSALQNTHESTSYSENIICADICKLSDDHIEYEVRATFRSPNFLLKRAFQLKEELEILNNANESTIALSSVTEEVDDENI